MTATRINEGTEVRVSVSEALVACAVARGTASSLLNYHLARLLERLDSTVIDADRGVQYRFARRRVRR